MGRKSEQIFFQRPTDDQQVHEKMIKIDNHHGNAKKKKTFNELAYHTCQNGNCQKRLTDNKFWHGCGEKAILVHYWQECKLVHSLWKTVWSFLQKLKIELPYDQAILFLDIYLKKTKTLI